VFGSLGSLLKELLHSLPGLGATPAWTVARRLTAVSGLDPSLLIYCVHLVSATRELDSLDRSWLVNGRLKFVGCLANLVSLSRLLNVRVQRIVQTEMRRVSGG